MHFKGEQMLPVFRELNVAVACLGNHDIDFGAERMSQLVKKSGTPWIMSNLSMVGEGPEEGKRIGGIDRYHVIENFKGTGLKIGLFGLGEKEWLEMLAVTCDDKLEYEDFV